MTGTEIRKRRTDWGTLGVGLLALAAGCYVLATGELSWFSQQGVSSQRVTGTWAYLLGVVAASFGVYLAIGAVRRR